MDTDLLGTPSVLRTFFLRDRFTKLQDIDGRPLDEVAARYAGATPEFTQCPYHGSRYGLRMNLDGLHQITRNWSAIIDGFDFIREHYKQHNLCGELNLGHVWRLVASIVFLPFFISHHGGSQEPLPGIVAGMTKTTFDLLSTLDWELFRRLASSASCGETSSIDAEAIARLAEEEGLLINGQWVCAGPPQADPADRCCLAPRRY